ncbi:MAG: hypothetical protein HQL90_13775 [Magnetococcales bacterium]|nr:hypothetical protein [Magnetococcales bacterium]
MSHFDDSILTEWLARRREVGTKKASKTLPELLDYVFKATTCGGGQATISQKLEELDSHLERLRPRLNVLDFHTERRRETYRAYLKQQAEMMTLGMKTLKELLTKGEFVGYGLTDIHSSRLTRIHPHQWNFLVPDFDSNTATGHGLSFVGLEFYPTQMDADTLHELAGRVQSPSEGDNPMNIPLPGSTDQPAPLPGDTDGTTPAPTEGTEPPVTQEPSGADPESTAQRKQDKVATAAKYQGWLDRYEALKNTKPPPANQDIYKQIQAEHLNGTGKTVAVETIEREIRRIKPPT